MIPTHIQTTIRPALPVDLVRTVWPLQHGPGDPTIRQDRDGSWWRATRTPLGPATTRISSAGGNIHVEAWGPGSAWAIERAPDLVGARDSLEGFAPPRGHLIRTLHRRFPGLRVARSSAVFEAAVPLVIEQKVIGQQARASYRALMLRFGEAAPGPAGLLLPPAPHVLARLPYHSFHPCGIEMKRANTIRMAAARAGRLEEALAMTPEQAAKRLLAMPGFGPWTAAGVAIVALGDADAVPIGDYHLPNMVAWALAGEARGTDERMLELLEPYAGHRGRVIRLLKAAGVGAPRFGPRLPLQPINRL